MATKHKKSKKAAKHIRKTSGVDDALQGQWSSGWIFVLAVSGAAIGFNNVWQFPAITVEYGGGAFLIVYLLFLGLIGLPLLMTEIILGRRGGNTPILSVQYLIDADRRDSNWLLLGWVVTLAGFLILSYLSVIGGWTIAYTLRAAVGAFSELTVGGTNRLFFTLADDPEKQLFWHSLFITVTMMIVARGLKRGLEPVIKRGVPLLFGLLILLASYGAVTGAFGDALIKLLQPDFTKLTGKGVLTAMGHAFFSLGLSVGAIMAYSAYLKPSVSIAKVSIQVVALDTAAGLLAGIFVLSLLIAGGQEVSSGPALLFQALPYTLDRLPGGNLMGSLFFAALALAAWLTAIALAEPAVSWLAESRGMSRVHAAIVCGLGAWAFGVVTILSYNYWAFSFKFFGVEKKLGMFDVLQIFTSNLLLPLGGILAILFVGWALRIDPTYKQLSFRSPILFNGWLWLVRIVTPLLLLILFFVIYKLYL